MKTPNYDIAQLYIYELHNKASPVNTKLYFFLKARNVPLQCRSRSLLLHGFKSGESIFTPLNVLPGYYFIQITYIVFSLLDAGFTLEDPLALQPKKKAQINSRKKNPFMPIKTVYYS